MWHMLGFGGAKTDSTANEAVPGVVDQGWTLNAQSRYIAPERLRVFAAGIQNDTLTAARINAPSLRNLGLPEIYPGTVSNIPATQPLVAYFDKYGPEIQPTEAFGIDASNGASTIDFAHGYLCVRNRIEPVPTGKTFTITATASITLVVDAWVAGNITLSQELPYGTYAVIGMYAICTACTAVRLVMPGQTSWRPGVPAVAAYSSIDFRQLFRYGMQGSWGTFVSTQPPQVEAIGTTAGAQTVSIGLDLVAINVPGSM